MAKIFNKGYVNDAVPPEPGENKLIVYEGFHEVFWERHEEVHDQRENVGTFNNIER